ncbi:hypothetical protein B0H10DRAFT_2242049 [Mycena sp. CBHHK59/15]|nr:hypothetical protein B0H10DRAFT_2242049 [Mycena sp. CBHHK59/15]
MATAGGSTLIPGTLAAAPAPAQRARFKLSDILLDSDSEDAIDGTQFRPNTLGDILMDGNQFFDADRNEIFFSAGTEETRDSERRELLEGIRNLDYYDHTVFGKMDREDLTISDAVAAMADMGLEDSDDESEADYNHDDSGWHVYA